MQDINVYVPYMLIILLVLLFLVFVFVIIIFVLSIGKKDRRLDIANFMHNLEKNIINDSHENFVKVINTNQQNTIRMSKEIETQLDKIRDINEKKLKNIEININEKLDKSLNERLDSSFKTIGEQLQNLSVTSGKLLGMSDSITDLQKSLSNVKQRGVFGEKQLENILENIIPKNMFARQYKISEGKIVDFAIKIPNKDDEDFIYLPIDAKFPNDRYMAIVKASNDRDENALNAAIKELKIAILNQAKSISEKYIQVPTTTEFALMFLPTEGLYAECLRIEGLAEMCQEKYHILLSGPTTITALVNSFSLGFKFLQINKESKKIAKVLQAIKAQYIKFDEEIEKTKRSIDSAAKSTEQLAKRNQSITGKLKTFDGIGIDESDEILEITEIDK